MTKSGYLTRIALAAVPPVDGGEREPEREVEPLRIEKQAQLQPASGQ